MKMMAVSAAERTKLINDLKVKFTVEMNSHFISRGLFFKVILKELIL